MTRSVTKRYTHKEYLKRLKVEGKGHVKPLSEYAGSLVPIPHECTKCGHVRTTSPTSILRSKSTGCPICSAADISKRYTKSTEEFETQLRKKHGTKIQLIGNYRANVKLRFKCFECLNTWKMNPFTILKGSKCPACHRPKRTGGYKIKTVTADGHTLRMQGYEPQALEWILNKFPKLKVTDIIFDTSGETPRIKYKTGRRTRTYYPDMFIPSQNRIIEVKSAFTVGLKTGRGWGKTQAKARACIAQGYKFTLLLMHGKEGRVWMPKLWYSMTRVDVMAAMAHHQGLTNKDIPQGPVFIRD